MTDQGAFDPGALDRLHRIGGDQFVVEMIDLFLENAPQRLEAARAALAREDRGTLHRLVHSLKSTAATLGARSLESAATVAETWAKRGDLEAMPSLLAALDREYGAAKEQLEAERDRRTGA